MKFGLVSVIFSNLVANDYKSHAVINGVVTFWLISTSDIIDVFFNVMSSNLSYLKRKKIIE